MTKRQSGDDYTSSDGTTYTGGLADQKHREGLAGGVLQILDSETLAAVARGEVDLNAIARAELGNRGLDRSGKWVGFPKAQRIAKGEQ